MSKPETLRKVEYDIRNGNLGLARDRLHGLMLSYPDDLNLRVRLGEVYSMLQQPVMAGRYWYLVAEKRRRWKRRFKLLRRCRGMIPKDCAGFELPGRVFSD